MSFLCAPMGLLMISQDVGWTFFQLQEKSDGGVECLKGFVLNLESSPDPLSVAKLFIYSELTLGKFHSIFYIFRRMNMDKDLSHALQQHPSPLSNTSSYPNPFLASYLPSIIYTSGPLSSVAMEVLDLIACTENNTWIDACVELPPNQPNPKAPTWVLLGKLITYKEVGLTIITNVVNRTQRPAFQVQVTRLDNKLFMFSFQHEANMANTFRRRPWSIRGGHLVLKHWNPSLMWHEIPFSTSTFQVQVHDLLELWRSPINLRKLGEKARKVVDVDYAGDGDGSWKRFIHIQVEVNLLQPLMPCIFLLRNNLPHLWIGLRYEKLVDVCYRCRTIGHETHACLGKTFFIS